MTTEERRDTKTGEIVHRCTTNNARKSLHMTLYTSASCAHSPPWLPLTPHLRPRHGLWFVLRTLVIFLTAVHLVSIWKLYFRTEDYFFFCSSQDFPISKTVITNSSWPGNLENCEIVWIPDTNKSRRKSFCFFTIDICKAMCPLAYTRETIVYQNVYRTFWYGLTGCQAPFRTLQYGPEWYETMKYLIYVQYSLL